MCNPRNELIAGAEWRSHDKQLVGRLVNRHALEPRTAELDGAGLTLALATDNVGRAFSSSGETQVSARRDHVRRADAY
jgi:hypothetical protein